MSCEVVTDVIELKKMMIEKGVNTISQLVIKTDISRDVLGPILKGERQPSSRVMNKLIFSLEIPPEKAGKIFFNKNLLSTK